MKIKIIFLTIIILMIIISFVYNKEGMENLNQVISVNEVDEINKEELNNLVDGKKSVSYNLLKFEYNGVSLPYDEEKDIYYLTVKDVYNFDIYYDNKSSIKKIIYKDRVKIIAYNKYKYKIYNIILTDLPIVNINLNDKNEYKEIISDEYKEGSVTILDNESKSNFVKVINKSAKFKTRGNSSLIFEKKSYSIRFFDPKTNKDLTVDNVLGLKDSNMLALNSLYEDDSKIRDVMSLNLWRNIDGNCGYDVNIHYVELFINNKYYGLYGLSNVINEYTMDIQDDKYIIYKVNDLQIPSLDIFNDNISENENMEIVYPQNLYKGIWDPIKNLINLVYYSDDETFNKNILKYIDIDNCVDFFILLETSYDVDGVWKNNVFKYDNKNNKLIKTAWDLDLTWGAYWSQNNNLFIEYNKDASRKLLCEIKTGYLSTYLEQRLWENNVGKFRQKVAQKWHTLRKGFLETETFVNYANSLYDEVTESGAREREHERWPDGGYSTDNKFIETFIRQRLEFLDGEFLKYLNDDTGGN